ncbi:MAG: hypothetical protein ACO1OB_26930 [Archangium sp.]
MLPSRTALLCLMVLGGCSASQAPGTCSISITGAREGAMPCASLALTWNAVQNRFNFTTGTDEDPNLSVLVNAAGPGEPSARTYEGGVDSFTCSVSVGAKSGSEAWRANADEGTCTLRFDTIGNRASSGAASVYFYTGTLDATLEPVAVTGATGSVTLSETFSGPLD